MDKQLKKLESLLKYNDESIWVDLTPYGEGLATGLLINCHLLLEDHQVNTALKKLGYKSMDELLKDNGIN